MTRPRALELEDFDRLRHVGWEPSSLSLDGKFLCFPIRSGQHSYGGDSFCIVETGTGALMELRGGEPCFRATWNPRGDQLAFYSPEDEVMKLWLWEAATGQARTASDDAVFLRRDDAPQWSPDGKTIYLPLRPQRASGEASVSHGEMSLRGAEDHSATGGLSVDVFVSPSPEDDVSFPGEEESLHNYADIGLVDLVTGETSRLLSGLPVVGSVVSPDGSWLALIGVYRMPEKPAWRVVNDLYVMPTTGGTPRLVGENLEGRGLMGRHALSWSHDSSAIAFVADRGISIADVLSNEVRRVKCPVEIEHSLLLWTPDAKSLLAFEHAGASVLSVPSDVWKIPLDCPENAVRLDFPSGRGSMRAPQIASRPDRREAWSADGQSCVLLTQNLDTKAAEVWRLPLDGSKSELLFSRHQAISRFEPAGDADVVAFAAEDGTCPADFWVTDTAWTEPRRITRLNSAFEALPRGSFRPFSWLADNGATLHGAVLLPPEYREGERIPVILEPYPGVTGSNQMHVFGTGAGVIQPQMLATRGFGVVLVDLEGPVAVAPPAGLMQDLGGCIDALVRMGIADPDRLGVMGQSGAGGAVNRLITETTIFKAAVCVAGVANTVSWFGQFDVRPDGSPWMYGAGLMEASLGGPPWERPEDYAATSPVMHLDNVETPLLLIYGTSDDLVGVEQGGEMFAGLYRLGKQVTFARYRGEGHAPGEFNDANRRDATQRVVAWFEDHLGDNGRNGEGTGT